MVDMERLKNKKMTSTGISEEVLIVNDVGNSYLHLRHKVEVRSTSRAGLQHNTRLQEDETPEAQTQEGESQQSPRHTR